jgi:hypothetical protein
VVLRLTELSQYAPTAGFYVDYQYARAQQFLAWLTNLIHTTNAFRNVGMLGIANEPIQNANTVATMLSDYYPAAYNVSLTLMNLISFSLTYCRPLGTLNKRLASLQITTCTLSP